MDSNRGWELGGRKVFGEKGGQTYGSRGSCISVRGEEEDVVIVVG